MPLYFNIFYFLFLHTFNVEEGGSGGCGEGYEGEKQGHTGRHSLYTIKIAFVCVTTCMRQDVRMPDHRCRCHQAIN
jgi:hypothetical protein